MCDGAESHRHALKTPSLFRASPPSHGTSIHRPILTAQNLFSKIIVLKDPALTAINLYLPGLTIMNHCKNHSQS